MSFSPGRCYRVVTSTGPRQAVPHGKEAGSLRSAVALAQSLRTSQFTVTSLGGMKHYFNIALICISFITGKLKVFPYTVICGHILI